MSGARPLELMKFYVQRNPAFKQGTINPKDAASKVT